MKRFLPISMVVVLYLVLATIYSVATPLGEGPDEPGHAAFVFFLAREGRLPDQRVNEVPGEGHQPPLAYVLAVPAVVWLSPEQRVIDQAGNARFVWVGGDQANAMAHGSREWWPWNDAVLAWHLARLVSVAFGALTIATTWLAARRIQPGAANAGFALLAAALVAANPQFSFIHGLVNNDALTTTLAAVALWLCLGATTTQQQRIMRTLGLGMVLGLALLTKQSALVLVPVIGVALVVQRWDWTNTVRSFLRFTVDMFGVLLIAALISGWWYFRNQQLYGDPLGIAAFQAEFTTQAFDFTSWQAWRSGLVQLHDSFWARFGWMNLFPPAWVILVFGAVELIAVVGWSVALTRRSVEWRVLQWLVVFALIASTTFWLLAFARTAGLVAWQGRLLFPALPAIALVLAAGLVKLPRLARGGLLVLIFGLALWLPFEIIRPAYPFQTLPEHAALAHLGRPTDVRFAPPGDRGAELRGWHVNGEFAPGAVLNLTLTWHALGRQQRDWSVFVHVVDADDQIVAESNNEPRNGAFPMTQWVAGDWLVDQHMVQLPSDLAAGTYTLRVGLFDAKGTLERVGVWRGDELIGDYVVLDTFVTK